MSLRLNGTLTTRQKTDFDFVKTELNLSSQGEVIGFLLESYRELRTLKKQMEQKSEFELNREESEEVCKAIKLSGMTYDQIAKRGLLAEARKAVSLAKRQDDLANTDPEELKKMTFKGVASTRIGQVVNRIMEYNDTQPEQKNRFCISESLVFKLTGSNRNAVKEYFRSYKLMIDDHNQKYGLTNENNRKGKGIDPKQLLGL